MVVHCLKQLTMKEENMRRLSFSHKFYILLGLIYILSLLADIFNLVELDRYNGLIAILALTIIITGLQYYAAKKGMETLLSINREYKVRKLWNTEDQFDWKKVRENHMKWAPVLIVISLVQLVILVMTGDTYTTVLIFMWAIDTLFYTVFTRPLKYNSKNRA